MAGPIPLRSFSATLTGLLSLAATVAHASESGDRLDTVIVTAQRIGTSLETAADSGALGSKKLLDTPFSLTVIYGDEISRRQANSFSQIFINDPSISSASPSGTTDWWGAQIRGLGVRNYYIDGVPMLLYWGGEFPTEAMERIEALKGLTGFMYGFGSPGGAISYESKKPTQDFMNSLNVEYRNDSAFTAHIDSGGRFGGGEGLGYRLNVASEFGETYNAANPDREMVALALDYNVTSNLQWFGNAIYEDSKLKHEPIYFYWDMFQGDRLPEPTYDYENVVVDGSYYHYELLTTTTGLNWRINEDWKSKVVVGYSSKDHQSNKMFGYLLDEEGNYEGNVYNFAGLLKNYFGRLLLQGTVTTGSVRHELVFGADYQRATGQWGNDWYWSPDFDGNLYERQAFVSTRIPDFSLAPVDEDERQKALFASDTLHFGDHWQALLGLRYTDYELLDKDGDPDVDSGYQTDGASPTLALIFKPADNVSVYASYVEGMESGTRVGDTYANFGEVLDATVSKQYEVGVKYEQARMNLTAAAFRVERAAQIDEFRDDGLRYLTQDGLTLYDGIEAIANVAVTTQLTVGFGATYLDPGIDKVSPENEFLDGNVPAGASKWQILWNADYQVQALPGLRVFGTVRYFDDVYYDDANLIRLPDHTIATLGFQYQAEIAGHPTLFTGNLYNVFNEKYWELNSLGEGFNGTFGVQVFW